METPLVALLSLTLLPPAVIVAVVLWATNITNKRIDDLRSQMSREHDTLANKVDETNANLKEANRILIEHITNTNIHVTK
ncbi:MAG: hypothetical protein OXP71_01765 [Candidatus Poribacteria bacterium]|nr:hypothetical protein [Candidatus Poribacteria bacterium]